MPLGDYLEPGTLPKPLNIGRAGRLVFGVGALYYFVWSIIQREALIDTTGIHLGLWIGVVFALYYLPDLFVVGFSRPWGRWPQAAALSILAALVMIGFAANGSGWSPLLGWGLLIFNLFFYGTPRNAASVKAAPTHPEGRTTPFKNVRSEVQKRCS